MNLLGRKYFNEKSGITTLELEHGGKIIATWDGLTKNIWWSEIENMEAYEKARGWETCEPVVFHRQDDWILLTIKEGMPVPVLGERFHDDNGETTDKIDAIEKSEYIGKLYRYEGRLYVLNEECGSGYYHEIQAHS